MLTMLAVSKLLMFLSAAVSFTYLLKQGSVLPPHVIAKAYLEVYGKI